MMNACMSIFRHKFSPCPATHSFLVGRKCTATSEKAVIHFALCGHKCGTHCVTCMPFARKVHCFQPLVTMLSSQFHRFLTVGL
jgi:hypothetical protein